MPPKWRYRKFVIYLRGRPIGDRMEIIINFKIVTDSSADLLSIPDVPFSSVPLKIITDKKEYTDDRALDISTMQSDLSRYRGKSRTSCPSTGEYLSAFDNAENVFCVTITSGLSGSYNSACVAKSTYEEEHEGRRVHVIDSLSTGPECALIVEKLRELIMAGEDFENIEKKITEYQKKTGLLFMLESLHNLANNGRVSPIVAKISGILGIRIVGKASDAGTLEIINKSRGSGGGISDIIKNLDKEGYIGGAIRIHHAENLEVAEKIKAKVLEKWHAAKVNIQEARGLCSFYAERGGVLVGFERS